MHAFSLIYSPYAVGFLLAPLIGLAIIWTIVLKGYALWHAARGNQRGWFIAILILNTLGILEIVYLIWFRPQGNHVRHHATPHEHAVHHSSEPA